MKPHLRITHLYPELLNTYGDRGNIIAFTQRAQWRGITVEVRRVSLGDSLKSDQTDWYFIGGGQDAAQAVIADDLRTKAAALETDVTDGVPLLAICGGYQLLGRSYVDPSGHSVPGLGIFDATTVASPDGSRLVGNILAAGVDGFSSTKFIGFENHGGRTVLGSTAQPLARVLKGFGNDAHGLEGCVRHRAIGTYLHGSLLPKNPELTDWFIARAIEHATGKPVALRPLDDSFEQRARAEALGRFS